MAVTENIQVGTLVVHDKFGLGKVLLLDEGFVSIYFKDIEGEPKDAVKRLSLAVAKLTRAETQLDPILDNLPPMISGGKVVPPERVRLTEQQAVDLFIRDYRSFEDAKYLRWERNYKWNAHLKVREELIDGSGRRLVDQDPKDELPKLMSGLIHSTNLPATQEKIRLTDALKERGSAQLFGKPLLHFVDAPSADSFEALVEAVGSLPAKDGQRVLTWPVVTILPFLAAPAQHMFLKPKVTQRVADVFMFDLLYDSRPTWATYQRLLALSEILLNRLRPLGARDFIDVQSFMWIVEGIAYMKS